MHPHAQVVFLSWVAISSAPISREDLKPPNQTPGLLGPSYICALISDTPPWVPSPSYASSCLDEPKPSHDLTGDITDIPIALSESVFLEWHSNCGADLFPHLFLHYLQSLLNPGCLARPDPPQLSPTPIPESGTPWFSERAAPFFHPAVKSLLSRKYSVI